MRLVVLDGYTLNPDDLSWEPLHALAECRIFDRTAEHDILSRAQDASIVMTNKTPLRGATLESLPALRYIGVLATGYDVVDIEQATRQNIVVTNVPAYGTNSVAQMVFALLLELCNHAGRHGEAVRQRAWSQAPDWCFWQTPLIELSGKTMGIVGYGRIGRKVVEIASAFGMKAIVTSPRRPDDLPEKVTWGSLDEVFASADFVSLHCPLLPSTRGLVNSARIAQMKQGAFLINTSRGGLIVETDLAEALRSGRLGGAALDVLSTEPPAASNPLIQAENCLITPHISWATRDARMRLLNTAVSNLAMWIDGRPQNVVSPIHAGS
jgi:glycerate dehydrogenase